MSPRLRVLVAISSLEIGGAERQIVEICRLLRGEEFELHVVPFTGGGPLEQPLAETGARIHPIYPAGTPPPANKVRRALRAVRTTWRLRRALSRIRPDVMHSYLTETSALLSLARWPRRRPPFLFSKRSLVQWIARRSIYYPVARWTNARADLILANSRAVRDDAVEKEGVSRAKIRVVYNGVDTSLYCPGPRSEPLARELGAPPDAVIVGMVANLHLYKGHESVLRACARLADPRLRLVLVGREGNASESIRALVSELGLESRVLFAGPRADIPEVLRLFDVFVSASHEEGFSNSILEAMASGRAIVATAVGGSVEQIEEGLSGLLVPPRDAGAMETALARLVGDPALRDRLAAAARARAVDEFSLEALGRSMAEIYRAAAKS